METDPLRADSCLGETKHAKVQLKFWYRAAVMLQLARQAFTLVGFC